MDNKIESLLLAKQINPTAMRLVVLDFLMKQTSAVSLTDLEMGLDKTDRVTLYRTIRTFEEQGLVHKIEDGSGIAKFALCEDNCAAGEHHDLHIHFNCTVCKETFCLPKTKIPSIELPENYKTEEIELMVKGTCDKCSH